MRRARCWWTKPPRTLFPIAKDVKIQLEFNPQRVAEYRLIGYETRHAAPRGLQQRQGRRRRHRFGPCGDRASTRSRRSVRPSSPMTCVTSRARRARRLVCLPRTTSRARYGFLKIRYKLPAESAEPVDRAADRGVRRGGYRGVPTDVGFSTAVAAFGAASAGGKPLSQGLTATTRRSRSPTRPGATDPYGYRAEFEPGPPGQTARP